MTDEEKKAMAAALADMQEKCKAFAAALADGDKDPPADEDKDPPADEATSAAAALCAFTGLRSPLAALAAVLSGQPAGGAGGEGGGADPKVQHRHTVELAVRDGSLPPTMKAWAEGLSSEQLSTFLSKQKKVPTRSNGAGAQPGASAGVTSLSASDREVAKRLNISEEKFLAQKQRLAAQGKGV